MLFEFDSEEWEILRLHNYIRFRTNLNLKAKDPGSFSFILLIYKRVCFIISSVKYSLFTVLFGFSLLEE